MTTSTLPTTRANPASEAADPDCLDPGDAAALLRDAPWRRLVVLGDSVALGVREPTRGYRDTSFADRVAAALGHGRNAFAYQNFGVRDALLGEVRDTQLPLALTLAPDLAIVVAGGNDALRHSFHTGRVRRELTEIVDPLARAGALVVTIGLFDLARSGLVPREFARAMVERFDHLDAITAEVAGDAGGLHVDTHHHPRAADPAIYSSDRIHANARGHAIAATAIVRDLAGAIR